MDVFEVALAAEFVKHERKAKDSVAILAQPFWLNDFGSTYEFHMNFYGAP